MKPLVDMAEDIVNDYRTEDFVIPAQDDKGHTERQWFRCQPGMDRSLDKMVACKRFPFRTKGDIIRWSVFLGLSVLERMEGDMPSVLRQVDMIADIVREDQFQAEFENTFTGVSNRINQHMAQGTQGEARRIIAKVRAAIDGMPDGNWKDKYLARWKSQFSDLINSKGVGSKVKSGSNAVIPNLDLED